jgi:hypothetical protein
MEAEPLEVDEGSESGDVPAASEPSASLHRRHLEGRCPRSLLRRLLPCLGAFLIARLRRLLPHPLAEIGLASRQAALVLLSGGSPSGPTNPAGRGSGGKMDPMTGMEAGGGAGQRWRGGYGGARPGPEPGGCHAYSKVVDVLLLLGRKQHSYAQGHMLCLHYTLCLMQLSVVRNLILLGCSD